MPVFVREGKSVLFVHVPQTGGTSIENAFRASGYRMSYRDRRGTDGSMVNQFRRVSPQHMHAAMIELELRPERFDATFVIVRDPVARFRSEYVARTARDPRPDAASVERWAADRFREYRQDPYLLDNHLRPQVEFVVPGAQVFRFEDGLENAIATLDQAHDLGVEESFRAAQRPAASAKAAGAEVEVSDGLRRALRSFYAEDYERFGY